MSTDPVFMKSGGQYYWYHNDHLGTPQKLTTTSGAVVWSAKYSSFGKAAVDPSSAIVNPLRFPGQYEDTETGLYQNWFRYYQPEVGRYLNADQIRLIGGINFYSYVANNPMRSIDPWGLFEIYGYQNRGGGKGWESEFEFSFSPIDDAIAKKIVDKIFKPIKWLRKIIKQINTKPVGPNNPTKDAIKCGKLDAELLKKYQERFGDKKRLTKEEALKFLIDMYNLYPEMKDLYPAPEDMLNSAEENSKDHWNYKLRGDDKDIDDLLEPEKENVSDGEASQGPSSE